MVDPMLGIEMGKNQIDMYRSQMEVEHFNLACMVADELELEGYPVEIKEVGTHRIRGIKVKKWIIVCKDKNTSEEEFTKKKDEITKILAKERQKTLKREIKEFKKKKKEGKI